MKDKGQSVTDKDKQKSKQQEQILNILLIAGLLVIVAGLCGLIYTVRNYSKSNRIYNEAQKEFVVILPEKDSTGSSSASGESGENKNEQNKADTDKKETDNSKDSASGSEPEPEAEEREWYELARVNLERLQAAYPDVAGWILFENEAISYPIVYSGDNETYLRTTYTGRKAEAGSIFLDGESTPDFSDPHTLIYGHNMKNLTMFGRLRYYKTEKDYYEDHRYFQIFTGGKIYRYEIFAYGDIPADSSIYNVYGASAESILELIREIKQKSYQDTGVAVGASDHIITLSTCTADGNERMIVSAVRVDEHIR